MLLYSQVGQIPHNLCRIDYPPGTNITPEKRPSQKEGSLPTIHFQGQTGSFREGNIAKRLVQQQNSYDR